MVGLARHSEETLDRRAGIPRVGSPGLRFAGQRQIGVPQSRSQAPRLASLVNPNRLQYRQCTMVFTSLRVRDFVLCKHAMDGRRPPKRVVNPCLASWFGGSPGGGMGDEGVPRHLPSRHRRRYQPSSHNAHLCRSRLPLPASRRARRRRDGPPLCAHQRFTRITSPFPDQNPPRSNDQRGGLLGGLFS
jgi:hypothetical protein